MMVYFLKTVEVRSSCQEKPLSARDGHWWNPRKKILSCREQQHKKRVYPCTDRLSATQWSWGGRSFQHPPRIQPTATCLNHWAIDLYQDKEINCNWIVGYSNLEPLFVYRIVVPWLLRLNIKARRYIPEFLNSNLWSVHLIRFRLKVATGPVNSNWRWDITFYFWTFWLHALVEIANHARYHFQAFDQSPFWVQVADVDLLLCTGFDWEHVDLFLWCITLFRDW